MIEIQSTLREVPVRAVIYGADGIGKSTLCAGAPGAVFVATEDGLANIDAKAVPRPKDWPALLKSVDALADDSRVGTIVIDSLDWAEQLLWAHIVETKPDEKGRKVQDIEGYGYGKGYVAALAEWRNLLYVLQSAGEHGKHVLLTAHAHRKVVKNPSGEDYEQIQIKLQDKAAGLIREWVHVVAFAELDIATVTDKDDGGRTKGMSTGRRYLRTHPSAGYQGKSRLTLPERIPLDWRSFAAAIAAGRPPSAEELHAALMVKLTTLDSPDVAASCSKFLDERGATLDSLTAATAAVDKHLAEKAKKDG